MKDSEQVPIEIIRAVDEETKNYYQRNKIIFRTPPKWPNYEFNFSFSSDKWGKTTIERKNFWRRIIYFKDYDYFFEKFPELARTELTINNVKYII